MNKVATTIAVIVGGSLIYIATTTDTVTPPQYPTVDNKEVLMMDIKAYMGQLDQAISKETDQDKLSALQKEREGESQILQDAKADWDAKHPALDASADAVSADVTP